MKKEVIWSKAFVMIIVHCKIPSKHRTYAGLIYIQFRLFVKVKRTNIFHKHSQCYTIPVAIVVSSANETAFS